MKRIIMTGLASMCVLSCGFMGEKGTGQKTVKAIEVGTYTVESRKADVLYTYVGKAEPSKNSMIYSQAMGTLSALNVHKGSRVERGEVLAIIKSDQAEAAYEIAEANLGLAQDGYDRAMKVYENGGITPQKIEEIKAQLSKAEASVKAAQRGLENCKIKAPYDGIINEVYIEEGTEVSVAAPIARIMNINNVEISFAVPEKEIGRITVGHNATVYMPALGKTVDGKVSVIGHIAAPMSHTYECTLIPDDVSGLLPGMSCKVNIAVDGAIGMSIPVHAVLTDADGRFVWSVSDGTVMKKHVTVSGYHGDGVLISDGLNEGDLVIVEGRSKVSSGMNVNAVSR